MSSKLPSRFGIKLILLSILIGLLFLWVKMDWPCLFRSITSIPCIGCGLSRAWLAALRLDFSNAFRYHPVFWSIPVLVMLALFDGKLFRKDIWNRILLILPTAGLFVCYIIRLAAYLKGNLVF